MYLIFIYYSFVRYIDYNVSNINRVKFTTGKYLINKTNVIGDNFQCLPIK